MTKAGENQWWHVVGADEELAHILDKLYELLREMGREYELETWGKTLGAEDTTLEKIGELPDSTSFQEKAATRHL